MFTDSSAEFWILLRVAVKKCSKSKLDFLINKSIGWEDALWNPKFPHAGIDYVERLKTCWERLSPYITIKPDEVILTEEGRKYLEDYKRLLVDDQNPYKWGFLSILQHRGSYDHAGLNFGAGWIYLDYFDSIRPTKLTERGQAYLRRYAVWLAQNHTHYQEITDILLQYIPKSDWARILLALESKEKSEPFVKRIKQIREFLSLSGA